MRSDGGLGVASVDAVNDTDAFVSMAPMREPRGRSKRSDLRGGTFGSLTAKGRAVGANLSGAQGLTRKKVVDSGE